MVAAGAAAAIVAVSAAPASAWDCIRVSGSQAGLQHSTASGNWMYATIDDVVAELVGAEIIPQSVAPCVLASWKASGEPSYFAMGVGVAGARGAEQSGHMTQADFFELAKNAPVTAVTDGHGVDHLEDALLYYAGACLGG